MQHCPECHRAEAWMLGDGRCKCKACGARYRLRSVWDSIRLPDTTKQELLQAFVAGRSAYRQRFESGACVDSRERFNRLVRACCTLHESVHAPAIWVATCRASRDRPICNSMRGWAGLDRVLVVALRATAGRVSVDGPSPQSVDNLLALLSQRVAVGGVHCSGDDTAFATLRVRGDYIVVGHASPPALGAGTLDEFWSYTRRHMQPLRTISRAFVHLHLGEMCYRFNHRQSDLAPGLQGLLQTTDVLPVRALIDDAEALSQSEPQGSRARAANLRASAQGGCDA